MPEHATTLRQFCSGILGSGDLESKLSPPQQASGLPLDDTNPGQPIYIDFPQRDPELAMQSGAPSLPRPSVLREVPARATCLARFAHHELMATELFAWALLRWPDSPAELRQDFTRALADEQRHCRLYLNRLEELGSRFSDYTHSNYFWRLAPVIAGSPHGPRAFLAGVGLTLEQANLDFMLFYRDAFKAAGDTESAAIFQQIYEEEIEHVGLAARWIRTLGPPGTDTIEAYEEAVPFPLSAARAKGRRFDLTGRRRAGLDEPFIDYIRRARSTQETGRLPEDRQGKRAIAEPSALLFPNLGGEEFRGKGGVILTSSTAPTLRLWRFLFGTRSQFLVPSSPGNVRKLVQQLNDPHWPEGLGPPTDKPIFPWLNHQLEIVPWIATTRVQTHAGYTNQPIASAAPAVVGRVHDKAFALTVARSEDLVSPEIANLSRILTPGDLADPDHAVALMQEAMASWPNPLDRNFTLKPRLGTSGRGRVPGVGGNPDSQAVRGALKRLARRGGAILEPWFKRETDLSAQLHVSSTGEITLLGSLEQIVAPSGMLIGHRAEIDSRGRLFSGTPYDETVREAAVCVARAAHAEGFHGPCGIDAFTLHLVDESGNDRILLRPLVEFNARFTVGTIAVGIVRRVLPQIRDAIGLQPSNRRALFFSLDSPENEWAELLEGGPPSVVRVPLGHPDDEMQPALIFAEDLGALAPFIAAAREARRKK